MSLAILYCELLGIQCKYTVCADTVQYICRVFCIQVEFCILLCLYFLRIHSVIFKGYLYHSALDNQATWSNPPWLLVLTGLLTVWE